MIEQQQEQDRTEEATPFKLQRAREQGSVARGLDLGFLGGLVALAAFLIIAGHTLAARLGQLMRQALVGGIASASDAHQAAALAASIYRPALQSIVLFGVTVLILVLFLEIVQLRGFLFSTKPLRPDFSRLNPAKGAKRIFSVRMMKEALKNIVKLCLYSAGAALVIRAAVARPGRAVADAQGVARALDVAGMRLLFLFIVLAMFFAAVDQILVRREFAKQMRMSRREVVREAKEREGEPRLRQRRKQLHREFAKQAEGIGRLRGSDMLIVNPHHVAVALAYDPEKMSAPTVTAKARNHFALVLRREAFRLGIPIFESPVLARSLFKDSTAGSEIAARHFHAVADLYFKLRARGSDKEE